jgi:uncharacterized membrane protein
MQNPLHPFIVHFPIAFSVLIPFLAILFAVMIKKNKMAPSLWLVIIGLQLATTILGYVALETGETEEHTVEKVVDKAIIHEHEEASEIFVGSTVIVLALSIAAYFLRAEFLYPVQLIIAGLGFISLYLGISTGKLGGALVYEHGAASAYAQVISTSQTEPVGILPTPGENTSETPIPVDENESLKKDDNDYGNNDDVEEVEDDEAKQED